MQPDNASSAGRTDGHHVKVVQSKPANCGMQTAIMRGTVLGSRRGSASGTSPGHTTSTSALPRRLACAKSTQFGQFGCCRRSVKASEIFSIPLAHARKEMPRAALV
jgi:hypothetical protein